MMANNRWHFIFLLLVLSSCTVPKKKLDKDQYVKWVRDEKNGLKKIKTIGEVEVLVQYKPIEYMALREYLNNVNPDSFPGISKQYKGMQYYDMSVELASSSETILKHDLTSEDAFYNRLNYFSFQAKQDMSLEENGQTLDCKLYHFERSYDLSKHSTILLGFIEREGHEEDTKILKFDATKLGLGIIKIEFESSDLKKIPLVKL